MLAVLLSLLFQMLLLSFAFRPVSFLVFLSPDLHKLTHSLSHRYKHFSTAGSRCYNKLFDFNPGAEPPVEEWLGRILAEDEAEAGGGEAAYHVGGWNPFA